MAQFAVHRNPNAETRVLIPFLLDVQSDLLGPMATRVVVPLYTAASMKGAALKTLMPTFKVEGRAVVMATPELAGIPRRGLGPEVADLSAQRSLILGALDFLITGI